MIIDASIFYYLENWRSSPSEPYSTHYLTLIESFQRHITTAAYKIASGADPSLSASASRPARQQQTPVPQGFTIKITRSFMDSLYAFLDGLVLLASDESPIATGKMLPAPKQPMANVGETGMGTSGWAGVTGLDAAAMSAKVTDPLDLLDLKAPVCVFFFGCCPAKWKVG